MRKVLHTRKSDLQLFYGIENVRAKAFPCTEYTVFCKTKKVKDCLLDLNLERNARLELVTFGLGSQRSTN